MFFFRGICKEKSKKIDQAFSSRGVTFSRGVFDTVFGSKNGQKMDFLCNSQVPPKNGQKKCQKHVWKFSILVFPTAKSTFPRGVFSTFLEKWVFYDFRGGILSFLVIFGHFLVIFGHFDHFRPFLTIFGSFLVIFDHFGPFLTIFQLKRVIFL